MKTEENPMKTATPTTPAMAHDAHSLATTITASAGSVIDRVSEIIRRNAMRRQDKAEGREPRAFVPPPPVASHLTGFTDSLVDKVEQIADKLDAETRARVIALVPGVKRALMANDPDLIGLYLWALTEPAQSVAEHITLEIDNLEGWLAS